jgi:hypothetical protein
MPTLTLTPDNGLAGITVIMSGSGFNLTQMMGSPPWNCWDLGQNHLIFDVRPMHFETFSVANNTGYCMINSSGILKGNFTVAASWQIPNGEYVILAGSQNGMAVAFFTVGRYSATQTQTVTQNITSTHSVNSTLTVYSNIIISRTITSNITVSSTSTFVTLVTRSYNVTITQRVLVQSTTTVPFNVTTTSLVTATETTKTTTTVSVSLSDPITNYGLWAVAAILAVLIIISLIGKIRGGGL